VLIPAKTESTWPDDIENIPQTCDTIWDWCRRSSKHRPIEFGEDFVNTAASSGVSVNEIVHFVEDDHGVPRSGAALPVNSTVVWPEEGQFTVIDKQFWGNHTHGRFKSTLELPPRLFREALSFWIRINHSYPAVAGSKLLWPPRGQL
jgi:hypothetical protein